MLTIESNVGYESK